MSSEAHNIGQQDHAGGKSALENPYAPASQQHADWLAGWNESAATAAASGGGDVAASASGATAAVGGTVESAAATTGGLTEGDGEGGDEDEEAEPAPLEALGEAGYERILDLLDNPPIPDIPGVEPGEPAEVPEGLEDWLEAFKEPLIYMTVDTAASALQHRVNGTDRGRLKELYRKMTPADMAALMQNNADAIRGFADQRAAEAAMIVAAQTKLTNAATGFLLNALLAV